MDTPPVQFVKTRDGYNIAYTAAGRGAPFLLLPHPFNHQKQAWEDVYFESWMNPLASRYQLLHFDMRGTGMSSRGLREGQTIEDYLPDIEAVVSTQTLGCFVVMASYEFWRVAIRYAATHPDRIRGLILFNPDPPVGPEVSEPHPFETMAALDWESFLFTSAASYRLVSGRPGSSVDQVRASVEQSDYIKMLRAGMEDDARPWLSSVEAPTLIICERPAGVSEDYVMLMAARQIAAAISTASLVTIDGMGEAFLTHGPPSRAIRVIEEFVDRLPKTLDVRFRTEGTQKGLSLREMQIVQLLAEGRTNQEIADKLVLSRNTVRHHVSSVLDKLGAPNRAHAVILAREMGLLDPLGSRDQVFLTDR
jgi:DNA-binding NarL/FixJ family response regulator